MKYFVEYIINIYSVHTCENLKIINCEKIYKCIHIQIYVEKFKKKKAPVEEVRINNSNITEFFIANKNDDAALS